MFKGLLFAAAVLLIAGPAAAQSRPTAEQIIAALKPSGQVAGQTRGIRPVGPAAAGAPVTQTATAQPARAPSMDLNVNFEFGSATLTADAVRTLDELGRALSSRALAPYRFRIEGHTDTVGTADFNKALSDQRAANVARYLEARFGVGASRLDTVGLGDTALLIQTPPQTPEGRNRRVHVVNLGS